MKGKETEYKVVGVPEEGNQSKGREQRVKTSWRQLPGNKGFETVLERGYHVLENIGLEKPELR